MACPSVGVLASSLAPSFFDRDYESWTWITDKETKLLVSGGRGFNVWE